MGVFLLAFRRSNYFRGITQLQKGRKVVCEFSFLKCGSYYKNAGFQRQSSLPNFFSFQKKKKFLTKFPPSTEKIVIQKLILIIHISWNGKNVIISVMYLLLDVGHTCLLFVTCITEIFFRFPVYGVLIKEVKYARIKLLQGAFSEILYYSCCLSYVLPNTVYIYRYVYI